MRLPCLPIENEEFETRFRLIARTACVGFGVVAQGVWMILDRCCIPRGATESPPWRLWVVRGLELFLIEALLFGTGAFYSPHSRLYYISCKRLIINNLMWIIPLQSPIVSL